MVYKEGEALVGTFIPWAKMMMSSEIWGLRKRTMEIWWLTGELQWSFIHFALTGFTTYKPQEGYATRCVRVSTGEEAFGFIHWNRGWFDRQLHEEIHLEKAGVSSYFIKTDLVTGNCTVMMILDGGMELLHWPRQITPDESPRRY